MAELKKKKKCTWLYFLYWFILNEMFLQDKFFSETIPSQSFYIFFKFSMLLWPLTFSIEEPLI